MATIEDNLKIQDVEMEYVENANMKEILSSSKCTLCLEDKKRMTPVNDVKANILDVFFKQKDNFLRTGYICRECWKEVQNFYTFYSIVKTAHKQIATPGYFVEVYVKDDDSEEQIFNKHPNKKCRLCEGVVFTDFDGMVAHYKTHHNIDKSLVCHICKNEFPTKALLFAHKICHAQEPTEYPCPICEMNFAARHKLHSHIREIHINIKEMAYPELLAIHQELLPDSLCNNMTRFKDNPHNYCNVCSNVQFSSFDDMISHYKIEHDIERELLCYLCHQSLQSQTSLFFHLDNHNIYKCKTCSSCFPSQKSLKLHKAASHLKEDNIPPPKLKKQSDLSKCSYECDLCTKTLPSLYSLNLHKEEHETPKRGAYGECRICKTLIRYSYMKLHRQRMHKTDNIVCEKCGNLFAEIPYRSHRKKCGQQTVGCNICKADFDNNLSLKEHLVVHTTEAIKKHKCGFCGRDHKDHKSECSENYRCPQELIASSKTGSEKR